jgi:hypothetical protein
MKHFLTFISLFLLLIAALSSCASFGTPSGGPPDKFPPKIDSLKSEKNEQVFFTKRKFELFFDEFVEVKNVSKQLLVSPPLTYKPKVESRGKKLSFEFNEKEELKEDATYIINFGESIKDYTAGNVLSNFSFVFSTGAKIDSLSLQGTIKDAYTGEPIENMIVGLYDSLEDSTVVKDRPFYMAKSNKNGIFKLQNLKSDTFQIIAIEDINLNLKYDEITEKIGFLDTFIIINDTTFTSYLLEASIKEKKAELLKDVSYRNGQIHLLYNQEPQYVNLNTDPPEIIKYKEVKQDTLIIYHSFLDSFKLYDCCDTISIKPNLKFTMPEGFSMVENNAGKGLSKNDTLKIEFNYPIDSIKSELVFLNDSTKLDSNQLISKNKTLKLLTNNVQDKNYSLLLLPGSITDIYGNKNDTIRTSFKVLDNESLGSINIVIDSLRDDIGYLVTLEQKGKVHKRINHTESTTLNLNFELLKPGKYFIKILEDVNGDGRWSPGDFWTKTKAETIKTYTLEELRANWELTDTIIWSRNEN